MLTSPIVLLFNGSVIDLILYTGHRVGYRHVGGLHTDAGGNIVFVGGQETKQSIGKTIRLSYFPNKTRNL